MGPAVGSGMGATGAVGVPGAGDSWAPAVILEVAGEGDQNAVSLWPHLAS